MARILRRLGDSPARHGASMSAQGCPDVFELEDGNFAVIGIEATEELLPTLPPDASVAAYERIVIVDRATILAARRDIPEE